MELVQKEKAQKLEDRWETAKEQTLKKLLVLDVDAEEAEDAEEGLNKMARPRRMRRVRGRPNSFYFKPAGIRKFELEEIILEKSEFEALRLKDYLGLEQEDCAKKMEISQPTFHRILIEARKKIGEGIVKGKAIKIEKS